MKAIRWVVLVVALVLVASMAPANAQWKDYENGDEIFTIVDSKADDTSSDRNADYLRLMAIPSEDTGYRPPDVGTPADKACPKSRCRDFAVPVPDDVKITSNMVRVYYPVGYFKKKNRKVKYPVIYLYPGARSPYSRWSEIFDLLGITKNLKAIFVMPSGGIGPEAGMFADWADGSWQWESFHVKVLIPWIDAHVRALPNAVGGVGASAGALGALDYAARNPGAFQGVLSISGVADTSILAGNITPDWLNELLGVDSPDLTRVWGNPILDRANWNAHNPTKLAADFKDVKLFIACGTGFNSTDTPTGDQVHTPLQEQLLWTSHRTFLRALIRAGVSYKARIREGGYHYWTYFTKPLTWGLPKLTAALWKSGGATPPA